MMKTEAVEECHWKQSHSHRGCLEMTKMVVERAQLESVVAEAQTEVGTKVALVEQQSRQLYG